MSDPSSDQAAYAARQQGATARGYYNTVLPRLKEQYNLINQGLAEGGEPGYVQSAFAGTRTGLAEGAALQDASAVRASLRAQGPQGTGSGMPISATQLGSQLANALWGSRVQEGLGAIGQMNNLQSMSLGQTGNVGGAAIGAAGNQLRAISQMPHYDPTYATVLGGLNAAGSLYGSYRQMNAGVPVQQNLWAANVDPAMSNAAMWGPR